MTAELIQRLAAPFAPEAVSWRLGQLNKEKTRGLALAYIDARDVMNRLDDVCGPFGWQSEHAVTGDMVTCRLSIRDPETGEWIGKTDGAGKTDVEGDKGAYSDALKRAAVSWGIGRYLYDTASPWVDVESIGRSHRIADNQRTKLLAALRVSAGVNAALKALPPPRGAALVSRPEQVASDPFTPVPAAAAPAAAPEITADDRREAIIAAWWQREDYSLMPDAVEGGPKRWGWWFLQFAKAAPDLAALHKLKNDNRVYHKSWASAATRATATQLSASLATIERGLTKEAAHD